MNDDLKYFVDKFLKDKSVRSLNQLNCIIDAIYINSIFKR